MCLAVFSMGAIEYFMVAQCSDGHTWVRHFVHQNPNVACVFHRNFWGTLRAAANGTNSDTVPRLPFQSAEHTTVD